ncbi:MAG: tetratricopeptide repeat protein [Dehalococcoidia bacterium]
MPRPRLQGVLERAFDAGVLVVTAPPGFGKTSLLARWLDDEELRTGWLAVTERHRDPVTLAADIAAALPREAADRLDEAQDRDPAAVTVGTLQRRLRAAIEAVDDWFVIVLDDLHVLDGATEANELIDRLIATRPSNAILCLLSRTRLDWPSLPRAIARGEAVRLEADDLAFDATEADAVLELFGVPADDRASIVTHAAGWPAALAILGQRYSPERREVRASARVDLAAFIDHEVIDAVEQSARPLLEACAVLPRIDADLAEEIDAARGEPALRHLANSLQLLAPLSGNWFGLHDLVRQRVLERLGAEDPVRLRETRLRTAAALERRGDLRGAFELALAAPDGAQTLRLARALSARLYRRGEWASLCTCIDALPADLLAEEPDLYLTRARVATKLQRPGESLAMLRALPPDDLEPSAQFRHAVYLATALRGERQFDEALRAYRRARAISLEHEPSDGALLVELDIEEGVALGMSGHLEAARARLQDAVEGASRRTNERMSAEAYENLGTAHLQLGELAAAITAFRAARTHWERLDEIEGQILTLNNIATVSHQLGELESARRDFEEVARVGEEYGLPRLVGFAHLGVADIERDEGRLDEAWERYGKALVLAETIGHGALTAFARLGRAQVLREQGDLDAAWTLVELGTRMANEQAALEIQARFDAAAGALLLERGRAPAALKRLRAASVGAHEAGARRTEATAMFLMARTEVTLGRERAAIRSLRTTADLVEQLGYDQFLLAEARAAEDLLQFAASLDLGAPFDSLARRVRQRRTRSSLSATREPETARRLEITAFGQTRARWSDASSDLVWRSERSLELLLYLLQQQRPAPREEIVLELWPDAAPGKVSSLFHSTLYRLRQALGADAVERRAEGYALASTLDVDYDVHRFERALDVARASTHGSDEWRRGLETAIEVYRGDFAPGLESGWADRARADARDDFEHAAMSLATTCIAAERYDAAVAAAEALVRLEPTHEAAVRHLIAARVGQGRPDLASAAYRTLRAVLEREQRAAPSVETDRLLRRLVPADTLTP